MIKKAYVIGGGVKKSLSPYIFNYWFKKYNINASYEFREIKIESFDEEIKEILKEKNVCGLNVTIPFKELIQRSLDAADTHSKKIGAVNCVSRINNQWVGRNTDWIGFSKSGSSLFKKKLIKKAIVLGYGGASKGIIYALKKDGFSEISVFNRTYKKLKNLKGDKTIRLVNLDEVKKKIFSHDIVINTTPVDILEGLEGGIQESNILAYDIVYAPKETGFLSHFKKTKRLYGLQMLVYQAAPCFKEWFGIEPVIDRGLIMYLEGLESQ